MDRPPWKPKSPWKPQVVAMDIAGRVPPHNTDAEAAVLSAVLTEERAFDLVADVLTVADGDEFYTDAHRRIWAAAMDLKRRGQPVDTQTVAAYLRDKDQLQAIGGLTFLTHLVDATPAVAHVAAHAQIVKEKYRVRRVIETCQRIAAEGYGDYGQAKEYIDGAEQRVYEIARDEGAGAVEQLYDVIAAAWETLDAALKRGERITGISSGFTDLDEMTSGMHGGELIIVAGRPGMGKTAYVLNIATNVAAPQKKQVGGNELEYAREQLGVMVFSLEMPKQQLAYRMMGSESRTDLNKLRKLGLSEAEWKPLIESMNWLGQLPIWIDDTSALSLLEIRSKVRRKQADFNKKDENGRYTHRVGLIIVDYLQLMAGSASAQNREQEVSENSRGLKALAKELDVPVIALSQLNRAVETRGKDKRPQLSDLRECLAADALVMNGHTGERVRMDRMQEASKKAYRAPERPSVVGMRGDGRLLSPCGVGQVWAAGRKTIFRVRTATGREVRCSKKHKFLTIDGWRTLGELCVGDEIAVPRRLPEPTKPQNGLTPADARVLGAQLWWCPGRVPDVVFRCSNAIVSQFVAGLLATHARLAPPRMDLRFPSTSSELLFDLQHLLLRFGVISVVSQSTLAIANLLVGGTPFIRQPTMYDRLPLAVNDRVIAEKATANMSWAQLGYTVQRGKRITRGQLLRVCDALAERKRPHRGVRAPSQSVAELRSLATSDVLWDPIAEVTKEGVEQTYDMSVPLTQNFVVNDILTHNSGAVEQDADVIQFVYRPEYYIHDKGSPEAQKLKGYAEILLAKQRNGPTGRVKMTFLDYCARFENRDKSLYTPDDDD